MIVVRLANSAELFPDCLKVMVFCSSQVCVCGGGGGGIRDNWLGDHICVVKRGNLPPGSLLYFFHKVARDLVLCAISHRQGITHPAFDDPVGSSS